MATGNIASSAAVDTASANATATYIAQAHGGPSKTYQTVYTGRMTSMMQIQSVDPTGIPTPVSGVPIQPLVPPVPQPLPRVPPIVGIVNSAARGVYFDGTLVPVEGDGINAPAAAPSPRVLTTGGTYPTIFIGTRT